MKCLYCDKRIEEETLVSMFLLKDDLCPACRRAMKFHYRRFVMDGMRIETFYEYDSLYRSMLLQYKECYDEALKDIFLYGISDYIRLRYHGYKIAYVPSSQKKITERGFDHLRLMCSSLHMEEIGGLKQIEERCQENKDHTERKKMMNNYLYTGQKEKRVLIVDDVLTSGSSLYGVYRALRNDVEHISAVVFAK